jgi:tetratricopeptide (TPR) repeat protein
MKIIELNARLRLLGAAAIALTVVACGQAQQPADEAAEESTAAAPAVTKVPITTSSEEALALYLEGQTLADHVQLLEAHEKARAAVEIDPEFASAYVLLAITSQTAAQFFAAVGSAEEYMDKASEGEQFYIRALIAGAENDQDAQFEALKGVMSAYPGDERTHLKMANYFNGQQDFDNAVLHFGHATSINPDFAGAFNSLGYAQRNNDNLEGAKEAFARYVELVPDEANPYDSYAELLMEMGQYEASIENYRKALVIDSGFASAYAGISINESLRGNADAAQAAAAEMLTAARTAGEKRRAMFRSVTAHLMAGNTDNALQAAEEILQLAVADENHAAMGGIIEYKGDIMLKIGEGAKAAEFYDSALSHRKLANTNDANKRQAERTHLFKTAIAAMVSGDAETAAERSSQYTEAAEAGGNAFERRRIHEVAAFHAMFNEDYAASAAHFGQASQLNPVVLYWSASVNKELGNHEKAATLAKRAAQRNTLSGNLPFFRAEALQLMDELAAM